MKERLSRAEIGKDVIQEGVETTAVAIGRAAGIVTTAVVEVSRTVGGLATDLFEIRAAARAAARDEVGSDDDGDRTRGV